MSLFIDVVWWTTMVGCIIVGIRSHRATNQMLRMRDCYVATITVYTEVVVKEVPPERWHVIFDAFRDADASLVAELFPRGAGRRA